MTGGIFDLVEELEVEEKAAQPRVRRDREAEGRQLALVHDYLARHPWQSASEIRDGIEAESGTRVERVQARLSELDRTHHLDRRQDGTVVRYRLGEARVAPRGRSEVRVRLAREVDDDTHERIRREVQALADRLLVELGDEAIREDIDALIDDPADLGW